VEVPPVEPAPVEPPPLIPVPPPAPPVERLDQIAGEPPPAETPPTEPPAAPNPGTGEVPKVEPAPPPGETKEALAVKGDFFKIRLDRPRFVYDVIAGRFLANAAEPLVFLPEGECGVLTLLDYEVKGVDVKLTMRPLELTYRINLVATGTPGLHAYRVEFINPKGNPVECYTTTLAAPQGYAGGVFHLALNDPAGEWTVRATDVLTGVKGEAKFTLK